MTCEAYRCVMCFNAASDEASVAEVARSLGERLDQNSRKSNGKLKRTKES